MNTFIPLYHDDADLEDVEGIIRSDSIVEVWHNRSTKSVTIRYKAPRDGRVIDHDEYYESFTDANVRYLQILTHIVDGVYYHEQKFNDIKGDKIANEMIKALSTKEVS